MDDCQVFYDRVLRPIVMRSVPLINLERDLGIVVSMKKHPEYANLRRRCYKPWANMFREDIRSWTKSTATVFAISNHVELFSIMVESPQ